MEKFNTISIVPLLTIIADLSALCVLFGGATTVAKTVIDSKDSKITLEKSKRYNIAMTAVNLGRKGSEQYLKTDKNNKCGLYMKKGSNKKLPCKLCKRELFNMDFFT